MRTCQALVELTAMIVRRFPEATFTVYWGEDPFGVHLRPIVDVEDTEEVLDVVIERLLELQIEEGLPLYVFPSRPIECVLSQPSAGDEAGNAVSRPAR
jgi:hypothetical protein